MQKRFSERLRLVLYKKRWTATRLADETGIDISTISRWKVKGTTPRLGSLEKIAAATGCNIEYLQDGTGPMYPEENRGRTNIQIGGDQNYQEEGATYSRQAVPSCKRCGCLSDDHMRLINLLKLCESPLNIKKMIEEYQLQVNKANEPTGP